MTRERLEELSKDPSNVVYEYKTTQETPLPMEQVKEYCRRLYLYRCKHARDNQPYDEEACRKALLKEAQETDPAYHRFLSYSHTPFVDLLLKKRSGIREFRNALHMIDVRQRMLDGKGGNELLEGFKKRLLEQYMTKQKK